MTLTRNLVRDLLPLYAAGEASAETRQVVEQWLATDPGLAAELAALREERPTSEVSPNRLLDAERAVIAETRQLLRRRAAWLTAAVLFTALGLLSVWYRLSGMHFPLQRFGLEYVTALLAVGCWVLFFQSVRRLRVSGL